MPITIGPYMWSLERKMIQLMMMMPMVMTSRKSTGAYQIEKHLCSSERRVGAFKVFPWQWSVCNWKLRVCPISETVLVFYIPFFNRRVGRIGIFNTFQCCAPEICEESSVWGSQRLYLSNFQWCLCLLVLILQVEHLCFILITGFFK